MLFWMNFPLLNAVVWMALTTHAAEGSNCTDGCPSHSISGVALPIDDIKHNISVWQKEDSSIYIATRERKTSGRKWYNITTIPSDDNICIVSPGLLDEPEYCYSPKFVDVVVYGGNSSWRLDCKVDSCGCRYHRLIGLRMGKEMVSKVFWSSTQKISKVVVSMFLHSNKETVTTFRVPSPPKWHDFFIGGRTTRGYRYQLMSSSLNVNESRHAGSVWIYGVNDEGEKIPSYFALGCDDEPTEYPDGITERSTTTGWNAALGVLPLVLVVAVVLIYKSRSTGQKADLVLESRHNEVPLEYPPPDLRDRLSKDDHEYSYIDEDALRVQLERERAEGLKNPNSVDRRSADHHEYCYIDKETLMIQLEKEKEEERRPRDLVDRRSTDHHEYYYIDKETLRIQLEKERKEGHRPSDVVDRGSTDHHEYCYIDKEALRIQAFKEREEEHRPVDHHEYCYVDKEALAMQLERERAGGFRPRASFDRKSTDHEYCYIDKEALRIQLDKEKRERLEGQRRRKMSTSSHDSKNSLYEEMTAGEG